MTLWRGENVTSNQGMKRARLESPGSWFLPPFIFAFRNQEDRKKQEEMERRRAEVEEKRRRIFVPVVVGF